MGMLDLNVDMEDSGTSNSSVVNMEESRDEDSSALVFDILKRETEEEEDKAAGEITTRPLFPVTCGSSQWLNLSSAEGDSQSDVRILEQKKQPQIRKSRRGPRSRSSQYRGVTFYRRTGRWESHIWDCGKQVYLGGFDTAHAAARAYDRAAIKFRGVEADINFCLSDYEEDLKQTMGLSKEEFVQVLRRQNSGVPRGSSKYKGLSPHKWEARMSSFFGKKEFMTSCEPRSLKGERSVETSRAAGSFHNLDLSLGISPPANESKKCDSACDIRNRRGPMVDRTGPTLIRGQAIYGVAVRSKYDQIYSNTYPGYVQNYEKMTVYQTSPWQLQSNGTIAPVPVLSSAASSKFNSSSNIDSSDPLPFNPQLQIVHQFNHNIHHQFPMLPESEQLKDLW